MTNATNGWHSYWNQLSGGKRLFLAEAEEYVRNLDEEFTLHPGLRVLDFGCGHGFIAGQLARRVGELCVWDFAESMRQRAREHLAGADNVRFLDLSAPDQVPEGPGFDLVLVNSVIQYMSEPELVARLEQWRRLLAPGGRIIVSDIIPPGQKPLSDLWAVLRYSARQGHLAQALLQVARQSGRYARTRKAAPLLCPSPAQLRDFAAFAGLRVSFLDRNLTHFPKRRTAVFVDNLPKSQPAFEDSQVPFEPAAREALTPAAQDCATGAGP